MTAAIDTHAMAATKSGVPIGVHRVVKIFG